MKQPTTLNEKLRPACFLDRDGTIVEDVHHLHRGDQLKLIPGAAAAIRELNQHQIPVVVCPSSYKLEQSAA
jgi:D-glycero-D-manno-heptose 1,7-bisphosphate phosphatase